MWPFKQKLTDHIPTLKRLVQEQYTDTQKARVDLGVEPTEEYWTTLLEMGKYFRLVACLYSQPTMVTVRKALEDLINEYEQNMDFDRLSVAVGMMAAIAFPPFDDESDDAYQQRVATAYSIHKAQFRDKDYD